MTYKKISKLIPDEKLKDIFKTDGGLHNICGRCTGKTLGHALNVIGDAMQNPEIDHPLCSHRDTGIVDITNLAIDLMLLKHLKIIKKKSSYFLRYDIYKIVDTNDLQKK